MMAHSTDTGISLVRAALQRGEKLTALEALRRFDLWSLATVIHSLRQQGMAINSELIEVTTKDGGTARVALYSLADAQGTARHD